MSKPSIICRGKNLHLSSLKHFLAALPKKAMSVGAFNEQAEKIMSGFKKTHSQIARQLGLIYCDNKGICHPRFTSSISFDDMCRYAKYWSEHYYIPNPYTPSFPKELKPKCIYAYIRSHNDKYHGDLKQLLDSMFGIELAEKDKARSYLTHFSDLVEFEDWSINVPSNSTTSDINVDLDRDDVEGFFHYFDNWDVDTRTDSIEDQHNEILACALLQFKLHRNDPEWANVPGTGYLVTNKGVREYYGELTVDKFKGMDDTAFGEFCKEHTWGLGSGKAWSQISQQNEKQRAECISFFGEMVSLIDPVKIFEKAKELKGVASASLSELMMKFHPTHFGLYNTKTYEVLKFLGLIDWNYDRYFDNYRYSQVMGILSDIRAKMVDFKFSRTLQPEDKEPIDFITVNEFIEWMSSAENQNLVKEKIMEKKIRDINEPLTQRKGKPMNLIAGDDNDLLMLRLMSALRAKPFVILAGHSGTGKSRIVRKLAYMTCNVDSLLDPNKGPQNFKMIQVKPNWHDSSDLLGYRSAINDNTYIGSELVKFIFRAYTYPDTPFFLCLDEMNLAPVEQYFAEFLSAMESIKPLDPADEEGEKEFVSDPVIDLCLSDDAENKDTNLHELGCESKRAYQWVKDHGFTIPKNLFVVGTVNMDESTNQFSRKVLDRAMTIEMTEASFADYGKVGEPSEADFIGNELVEKLIKRPVRVAKLVGEKEEIDVVHPGLVAVQNCLKSTPFAVAFRFANEYALYKQALLVFDPKDVMKCNALDHAVLMKVLPRIVGEAEDVSEIYCGNRDPKQAGTPTEGSLLGILKEETMLSNIKMRNILKRKSSYLTFWP